MGVDPGVVRRVSGESHVGHVERRKAGLEGDPVQQIDPRAQGFLQLVVGFHPGVIAVIRDKQIPPAFEADIDGLAVDRHHPVEFGEKIQPVPGHENVLG